MPKVNLGGDQPSPMPTPWWLERAKEPSTYQGLSILAGLIGQAVFHSGELGQQALHIGLALASVIQIGKKEPLQNRDY